MRRSKVGVLLIALLGLTFILGGCTAGGSSWTEKIAENEAGVRLASGMTTTVVLIAVKDTDKRAEIGSYAYTTAQVVDNALNSQSVDLSGVRDLARSLVDKSGISAKAEVGYLLDATADLIQQRLDVVFAKADASTKTSAVKSLIRGAAQGVMQATRAYAPKQSLGIPNSEPWSSAENKDRWLFAFQRLERA